MECAWNVRASVRTAHELRLDTHLAQARAWLNRQGNNDSHEEETAEVCLPICVLLDVRANL